MPEMDLLFEIYVFPDTFLFRFGVMKHVRK